MTSTSHESNNKNNNNNENENYWKGNVYIYKGGQVKFNDKEKIEHVQIHELVTKIEDSGFLFVFSFVNNYYSSYQYYKQDDKYEYEYIKVKAHWTWCVSFMQITNKN